MRLPIHRFGIILALSLAGVLFPADSSAQMRSEYRAFWVDTFNTLLSTPADIDAVISNTKAANANAIFAQVRRRGDSWYLNSLEPRPDLAVGSTFPASFPAGFDPLQDLITKAHANDIEVHAFVIVGAIWNKNPTFAPTPTLGPPTNPNHVFNLHGGYDPVSRTITPGPNNWLTRTLLPDGAAGVAFNGHRFGNDFWIDLGHPDASTYSVDVLMHLVRNYAIDGLHLDRIRYPEISVSGQTPTNGTNIGYNAVSVSRFQTVHNRTTVPAPSDNEWKQWRRDQVTNFVRRLYLNAIAERPQIRLSAALIVFGNGPRTEAEWFTRGEAYWRVYQDWRSWTEEGILDIAIPMNYKSEHVASNRVMFEEWNEWLKNHQFNRAGMIGTAGTSPVNSVEGLLRQTRKALAPSSTGNLAAGVIHFSMANSNAAVTNNPFAFPAVATTPVRTFAQFASGLTTGKSGTTLFEDPVANPVAIFNQPAFIPDFPWKSAPTKGHLKGFATPLLDTAAVTIENAGTGATRTTATDGSGFYGGVDLVPGQYFVKATQGSTFLFGCITSVSAGSVSTLDLAADTTAPTISVSPVTVPNDAGLCAAAVAWTTNASDSCLPVSVVSKLADGSVVAPGSSFPVGTTTVTATATDRAGNSTSADFTVTVLDTEAPVIGAVTTNKSTIWPPNSQMVNVRVMYSASDNCSVTTRLSVTSDEEGADDWTVVDEHTVELRAERAGNDGDRTYTITVTATDPAGNETTASVNVVVPHDMR